MFKKVLGIFALILMMGAGNMAVADERPCNREGLGHCFMWQFANLKHGDKDLAMLQEDYGQGAATILRRLMNGGGNFVGQKTGGKLYLWLKPEVADDPSFVLPGEQMRVFSFGTSSPTPRASELVVERNPGRLALDDSRLPNLGRAHYVLVASGGTGGLGWSVPIELLDKLAYAIYVPDGATTWPGKGKCLHFTPADFKRWRNTDKETTFEVVLYKR